MTQDSDVLNQAISAIPDLSANNKAKFDNLYQQVTTIFGLKAEEVYLTYINKPGNSQVRIMKQMPADKPVRLAIGLCGTPRKQPQSKSYANQAERVLTARPDLNCVVYMWTTPGANSPYWAAEVAYHRPNSAEAQQAKTIWPNLTLKQVTGRPTAQSAPNTSANLAASTPASHNAPSIRTDLSDLVVNLLYANKNVVLEGVPGTGKSFALSEIVTRWREITGRELAEPTVVVLHPSSSYEDLVEGLRPKSHAVHQDFTEYSTDGSSDGRFVPQLGRFAQAAADAAADPERDHLLVMDELNRANVPRALGELLLVLESTKRACWRDGDWRQPVDGAVRLTYTGTRFWIPDNLHVLATMNTADRSVAPLDAALRRRFVFKRVEPMSASRISDALAGLSGESQELFESVVNAWDALNSDLLRPVIGPDAVLGHSYLFELHRALSASAGTAMTTTETFLRYTLLPQLFDAVTANGREAEIFDASWSTLDSSGSAAVTTLGTLLERFDMRIVLEGEGLSRRLSIVPVGGSADDTSNSDSD